MWRNRFNTDDHWHLPLYFIYTCDIVLAKVCPKFGTTQFSVAASLFQSVQVFASIKERKENLDL